MLGRLGTTFIIIISIYLAFSGLQGYLASMYSLSVEKSLRDLSLNGAEAQEIDSVLDSTNKMILWDSRHPYYMSLAASVYTWKGYSNSGIEIPISDPLLLKAALNFESLSMGLRPTWSDSYAQQARRLSAKNRSISDIQKYLSYAQVYGPYERSTALATLELYFKYWNDLDVEERTTAARFFLEYQKFGLSRADLNVIISTIPNKGLPCGIATFNGLNMKACK
ncbi:hypothetical protein L4C33_06120 [Vibrio makurazakiensis]|uniref:hypothetical protein n=1 Tax=Vibrio makurazakiensis TaxID=2910250 RepID=UPI003D0AF81C